MIELSLLERLIDEDYGIQIDGKNWARSKTHDSLVIDREHQIFYWNSESLVGDAFEYLTKVRKLNFTSAKEYLRHNNFTGTFIHEIAEGRETITYPKLVEVFHQNLLSNDRDYFYNRTITDETIDRFQLGYYNGFYCIPIFQDGLFKQFQMRRDSPKLIRAYYRRLGEFLYNSDILKLTNKIYITESPIGAIVLSQNGIPAVSATCGASGFLTDWIPYFIRQKEIIVMYDNDKAGINGAIRTAKILGEYKCRIYNFFNYEGEGYAVDDYFIDGHTVDELMEDVTNNSKYSFELDKPKKKW